MNLNDSQRIATKLQTLDYQSAPTDIGADLVVVNACSVRQKAVDRIWGKIKQWQKDGKKVLLTGCVLGADKDKFLAKNIIFFNIKDLPSLGKIIGGDDDEAVETANAVELDYFHIRPQKTTAEQKRIAYIPIMTGCNNFCSYCAVPYTRGREVSRPENEIVAEIKNALKDGAKEIWLLGQNVNSYDNNFCKLLKKVDNLPYDFKFNFLSSNPHDMGPDLIKCFAKLKKWTHKLHLPLQSGDDEILRKMNRKYTGNQFLKLIANLKNQISNLKLSTDIIVGFPGETKKQFENTYYICQKIGFEKAYIAQYSPRPGTVAAKRKDDVSPTEKKRRWQILDRLINH